jgi:hypothetical protein
LISIRIGVEFATPFNGVQFDEAKDSSGCTEQYHLLGGAMKRSLFLLRRGAGRESARKLATTAVLYIKPPQLSKNEKSPDPPQRDLDLRNVEYL